ncbi:MAG: type II secretion system protein [bacterium]|nr:type II secretion system protein [bacterium]
MLKFKSYQGFTLIELLIVISIIGIMAVVLIGVLNPTRQRNRAAEVANAEAIRKVGTAVEAFTSANGTYPTDAQCNTGSGNDATCNGYLSSWPTGVTYVASTNSYYIKVASLLTSSTFICYKSDTGKVYKGCTSACAGASCVEGVL